MKKYVPLFFIILVGFTSCKTLKETQCNFPKEVECVPLGIKYMITIFNTNNKPIVLDKYYTKFSRTGKKYKFNINRLSQQGKYIVFDNVTDNKYISCDEDEAFFIGFKNGQKIINEKYTFKRELCGTEMKFGAKEIIMNP
jgi:hypothetical protein